MPRGYRKPYRKLPDAVSKRGQPSSTLRTPPTPPPGANPHFIIIEYAHSWEGPILYVACRSDLACHLWLRWTATPMGMHNRVTTLGGYPFMTDPKYCLVEYNDIEQNEAGDTEYHTFTFPGWAECEWRWWYLIGTFAGEPSPSASCIFEAHYLDQKEAWSLKHTDLIEKEVAGVIDHADGSITKDKLSFSIPIFEECQHMTYSPVANDTWETITLPVGWPDDVVLLDVQLENWDPVNTRNLGVRKIGSGETGKTGMWPHTMVVWRVPVNAAHQFEIWGSNAATAWFRLVGRYR